MIITQSRDLLGLEDSNVTSNFKNTDYKVLHINRGRNRIKKN